MSWNTQASQEVRREGESAHGTLQPLSRLSSHSIARGTLSGDMNWSHCVIWDTSYKSQVKTSSSPRSQPSDWVLTVSWPGLISCLPQSLFHTGKVGREGKEPLYCCTGFTRKVGERRKGSKWLKWGIIGVHFLALHPRLELLGPTHSHQELWENVFDCVFHTVLSIQYEL